MSVTVVLHIFDGVFSQKEIELWLSNTIGSKYCPLTHLGEGSTKEEVHAAFSKCRELDDLVDTLSLYDRWELTEQIVIGRYPHIRSALTDDPEDLIPPLINEVAELFGTDDAVITDEVIRRFQTWDETPNETGYESAPKSDVLAFLEKHRGKRVVGVVW